MALMNRINFPVRSLVLVFDEYVTFRPSSSQKDIIAVHTMDRRTSVTPPPDG